MRKGSRRCIPSTIQRIGDGTAIVILTQGKVAAIDECDYDLVAGFRWVASQSADGIWYAQATVRTPEGKRTSLTMHRLLLGMGRGDTRHVDHEDGNGLNNRRSNIRPATVAQNAWNRRKRRKASSRYRGVSYINRIPPLRKPWAASICANGVHKKIGYFESESEAAQAFNDSAKHLHGEFACLNQIEGDKP